MKCSEILAAAAAITIAAAPAMAREGVPEDLAKRIIAEGDVISAAPVSADPLGKMATQPGYLPDNLRTHEVFMRYDGELFLCYLRRNPAHDPAPFALCYGPEAGA